MRKWINTAISGHAADMRITMHLCRGNFRSSWIAQGGYEPVAELLFNGIGVDGYFMEFDTERAGGFDPLRFVPRNKTVVLGIVTSKTGEVETADYLKSRIDEASKFIAVEQLCLKPTVRVCKHGGRQCAHGRAAMGKAVPDS
jgi:5-methyltetrahydropteroyltriglutamate--homocysteine methyltransferase